MVEANETTIVPVTNPKTAPASKVMIAAPGSDSAVTATYTAKNAPIACAGFAA